MRTECDRCRLDKYREDVRSSTFYTCIRIEVWLATYCHISSMHKPWISDCEGCHKMARDYVKSLAVLLDKLGVRL